MNRQSGPTGDQSGHDEFFVPQLCNRSTCRTSCEVTFYRNRKASHGQGVYLRLCHSLHDLWPRHSAVSEPCLPMPALPSRTSLRSPSTSRASWRDSIIPTWSTRTHKKRSCYPPRKVCIRASLTFNWIRLLIFNNKRRPRYHAAAKSWNQWELVLDFHMKYIKTGSTRKIFCWRISRRIIKKSGYLWFSTQYYSCYDTNIKGLGWSLPLLGVKVEVQFLQVQEQQDLYKKSKSNFCQFLRYDLTTARSRFFKTIFVMSSVFFHVVNSIFNCLAYLI